MQSLATYLLGVQVARFVLTDWENWGKLAGLEIWRMQPRLPSLCFLFLSSLLSNKVRQV